MTLHFTVLASGSSGNASLVEADGFGLLLDIGLGPRQLAARLAAAGASWKDVHAVLLTHTHSDHWRDTTLVYLRKHNILLYCHAGHHAALSRYGPAFAKLCDAGLVRTYQEGETLDLAVGLRCRPLPVRHDGGPTFGFRLEGKCDLFGHGCALGYAADLGSWTPELAAALADVDLLAIEFNHDVEMEYASGRAPYLVARVLGEEGHLSNEQAAALLQDVVRRSAPGKLRQVVQLHLSRECNRPSLAAAVARAVLDGCGHAVDLHTARQDEPGPTFEVGTAARPMVRPQTVRKRRATARAKSGPPWLPGLELGEVV